MGVRRWRSVMAANVLSGSNQDGPSAIACIVAGETFVAPPPFNRDSEGESIVVGDSSMGAVDSEEEKAGGSIPFLLDCLQLCQIRRSQAFPPPSNSLVDTLFRDVRARVLDCLTRRHVIDDAQFECPVVCVASIKHRQHASKQTNGLGLDFPGGMA